ncbi:MAG: hypothetical protein OEL78_02380 [Hyphomicrobiales bacterium]|nr:hypothetical protein [Hyphomicrobiales bacterium]
MEESAIFAVALVGLAFAIASRRITDIAAMTILLCIFLHGVTATWSVATYKR